MKRGGVAIYSIYSNPKASHLNFPYGPKVQRVCFQITLIWLAVILSLSRTIFANRLYFSNKFPFNKGEKESIMRPARPIIWSNCGDPAEDLFQVESIEVSPDPPRRSSPLTVNLRGYLKETLDEGKVDYVARFGGFTLARGSLDGCSTLRQEPNLPQCPVKAGPINVNHTVDLPWHIPPGRYLINASGRRSIDEKQIFCIDLDVSIDLINGGDGDEDRSDKTD